LRTSNITGDWAREYFIINEEGKTEKRKKDKKMEDKTKI
jgi:hypothetical protein